MRKTVTGNYDLRAFVLSLNQTLLTFTIFLTIILLIRLSFSNLQKGNHSQPSWSNQAVTFIFIFYYNHLFELNQITNRLKRFSVKANSLFMDPQTAD